MRTIHRYLKPVYEMELSIYPVAVCGKDLQTGNPISVKDSGTDLYELKCSTDTLILSAISCSGECFVEMLITKDGEYYDCDEHWCYVDVESKKVKYGGQYGNS